MKRVLIYLVLVGLVLSLILGGCAKPAPAPAPTPAPAPPTAAPKPAPPTTTAADFYKSNTVTLVCGFTAGGGVDFAARAFANYWSEVTGGGSMMVSNKPGAGGILGTNDVFAAKPNGLTMGIGISGEIICPVLFQEPSVQFDLKKFNWIGFISPEIFALSMAAGKPYKSMKELQSAKGLKFSVQGTKGVPSLLTALLIKVFDLKDARIVAGYAGVAEMGLAAKRGEIDGYVQVESTLLDHADKEFLSKQPLVYADFESGKLFSDTPAVPKLVNLTPEDKALLKAALGVKHSRVFFTSPGVSDDRVRFIRDAFNKIVANEGFIKQMKPRFPTPLDPTTGEELAKFVNEVVLIPKEDVAKLDQLLKLYVR